MRIEIREIRNHNDKTTRILDDPTNGDILKALFPEATEYGDITRKGLMFANRDKMCIFNLTVNKDWWDAEYKGIK